jgi:hypothetical protein
MKDTRRSKVNGKGDVRTEYVVVLPPEKISVFSTAAESRMVPVLNSLRFSLPVLVMVALTSELPTISSLTWSVEVLLRMERALVADAKRKILWRKIILSGRRDFWEWELSDVRCRPFGAGPREPSRALYLETCYIMARGDDKKTYCSPMLAKSEVESSP